MTYLLVAENALSNLTSTLPTLVQSHLNSQQCHDVSETTESSTFINNGGFLLLFVAILYALWSISYCCEDFFVPALEVFCKRYSIPDSAAGAIVMAAGNDFPELFISLLGLFVEKSALGIGTVIGSEIFNHMCITAGACLYAKDGVLQLKPREFTRDCAGYMSSLIVLCFVVGANFNNAFNPSMWGACLHITTESCYVLIAFQALYCLVVIYFKQICTFFGAEHGSVKHIVEVKGSISHIMHETVSNPNTEAEIILEEILGMSHGVAMQHTKSSSHKYRTHRFDQKIAQTNPDEFSASCYSEADPANFSTFFIDSETAEGMTLSSRDCGNMADTGVGSKYGSSSSIATPITSVEEMNFREYCVHVTLEYLEGMVEPVRHLMYSTLYDTTEPALEDKYMHTIVVCILWMGFWAYVLCECFTALGNWLQISSVIMVFTCHSLFIHLSLTIYSPVTHYIFTCHSLCISQTPLPITPLPVRRHGVKIEYGSDAFDSPGTAHPSVIQCSCQVLSYSRSLLVAHKIMSPQSFRRITARIPSKCPIAPWRVMEL